MGSDNCVIAKDYSYITFYGKKYVPLITNGFECYGGHQIVNEAKVENADLLTKLFFGDTVYGVGEGPDYSILWLVTDYDNNISDYYVKESKLTYYENIINNAEDKYIYARIEQKDGFVNLKYLGDDAKEMLENFKKFPIEPRENCGTSTSKNEKSIIIYAFEHNKVFFRAIGEIIDKNSDKYYWYDYSEVDNIYADASETHPHVINESYYDEIETLFFYTEN